MSFLDLAKARYSVRKFDARPVEREKINSILQAALCAPTACNQQPWRVLVVTEQAALERFRRCTTSHFHAPAALVVCMNRDECWRRDYDGKPSGDIDASIVCTHMMLQAAALGLGTTWVMHFIPEAVREEFCLPPELEPVALLPLGYPAQDAQPSPSHARCRALNELVFEQTFDPAQAQ